ncbi:MAG: helix-turn-helix domain-containing protein [Phycisphaeraceae bacterium]
MADRPIHTLTADRLDPRHRETGVSVHRIANHRNTSPHDHLFHEIVYIEAGTAEHETAGGRQRLRGGDLIVLRPQVWHAYHHARGLTLINCLFDGRLTRRFADVLRAVPGSFDLFQRRSAQPRRDPPAVLRCGPEQRAALAQRLESMMAESSQATPGWELAVTVGLLDVLLITARLWAQQWAPSTVTLPPRTEQAVQETVAHLESHYTEPIDLSALAQRVHLSRGHLSRSFAQRMGMGVVEFAHRLRIEQACRRLRLTDDPVGQIATDLGYHEIAYFTRCFRKHLGQSPRAYRRASHATGAG